MRYSLKNRSIKRGFNDFTSLYSKRKSGVVMKAKILVVEDEKILAIGMKRKLELLGYTVTGLASSGQDAIEKAQKTNPDLVLMDIVLKGDMEGVEAAQQRTNLCEIPVIYLTA